MIGLLIALAPACGSAPVMAQHGSGATGNDPASGLDALGGQLRFGPAGVTLPERAARTAVTETTEFSHSGGEVGKIAQYRSLDGEARGDGIWEAASRQAAQLVGHMAFE